MPKMKIPHKLCFSLIILLLALSSNGMHRPELPYHDWGSLIEKVKSTLAAGTESQEFTPSEKPEYKNRILGHITAIDNKLLNKITILKVKTWPETDYLFVNNKLYSVIENWEEINQSTEQKLLAGLKNQFGKAHVQKDNNFYIYSYEGDRTKALCYIMKLPGNMSTCKVYYYTKHLFRLLLSE